MPVFEIEHGGKTYEVDAPDMNAALNGFQGTMGGQTAPQKPKMSALEAGNVGLLQGVIPFGDEIMAGMMTPVEATIRAFSGEDAGKGIGERISNAYDISLANQRDKLKQAQEEHPIITGASQAAGAVATGGQLAKGGATLLNVAKPTVPRMVAAGAGEGALYGGIYGFGEGEGLDDRLAKAARGAAIGGATGGALGVVGARGAQKTAEAAVPDAQGLRQASNQLYKDAENVGLALKPQSFSQNVDDIVRTVADAGIDRTIHPRATAALARLEESKGQSLTLKQFDTLRRVVNAAAKSNEPDERRIAGIMIDKLDDYLANVPASEVVSGDPKMASSLIENARSLWARARKTDVLDEINRRIDLNTQMFSGSGRENAIRSEFRSLAKRNDFKRMFSPAEQAAIEKVAKGGRIENALRFIGKLAPTGVVSTGMSGGMGYAIGGPAGAAATMGAGGLARAGATAMTGRNARAAELLVRNGGAVPSPAQLSGPQRAMIDLLLKGSAPDANRLPDLGMGSLSSLGGMIQ